MSEVAEKVKSIIAEHLGIDDLEKITNDAKFIDDLGADSLDTVELVMAFEEAFDVEIPDEKAEKILTVGDAVKFIDGKNNWHPSCLCMCYGFFCLRHNIIIRRNYNNSNISDLSSTCTHGCKSFVTRSV